MATATDDFNRANAGTLGANWTASEGNMSIDTNRATAANSAVDNWVYYSATAFGDDQYSQAVYTGTGGLSLTVRDQGGGTLYMLAVNAASGNIKIYKVVGVSSFTELGDLGVTTSAGVTYKLEIVGSTLKGYANGAQIGSNVTNSDLTGGQPGIGGAVQTAWWDDWEGGDVGGGGGGGTIPVFMQQYRRRRVA